MDARRGYAVGLAVLALAVSACTANGEEQAKTSSTSSSSSSTSTASTTPSTGTTSGTATVDPASLPPEARKHTPEGAAAFVKFYFEQVNQAWTKPDPGLLPPLSDAGCVACKALQATALQLAEDKQHYVSDPVTVTKAAPLPSTDAGPQLVRAFLYQHKVQVVDAAGKVVLTDQQKKLARTVGAVWRGERWVLYDMQ